MKKSINAHRRLGRRRRLAALTAAAPLLVMSTASAASAETEVDRPDSFTSAFTANAVPGEVINPEGEPAPGQEGATGTFSFMINSDEEIVCYDIELRGVTGEYESAAKTATHVHEAARGDAGPPRLAFPNPEGDGDVRTSSGCLKGPFTTGIEGDDGNDTGDGFSLSQIEDGATGFAADSHTADFVPGAVRGQLRSMPVGGVDTGQGGLADDSSTTLYVGLGVAGLVLMTAMGLVARRVRD